MSILHEVYETSLTNINYILLGLYETAYIIDYKSFNFWKNYNNDQLKDNYEYRIKINNARNFRNNLT